MPGEVDARLIALLQGSMGLADSLRDAGTAGEITVRLGREDGLRLLKLVAGTDDAEAEAFSQRGRPPRHGAHSLRVSNLTFEWPQDGRSEVPNPFHHQKAGRPANDNLPSPVSGHFYRFDEDAPALR